MFKVIIYKVMDIFVKLLIYMWRLFNIGVDLIVCVYSN